MKSIEYIDEWKISERYFDSNHLGKYEAIMAQGNGYLGLRNVHEEEYPGETRDMFVAGVFNKFSKEEVTELANFPDVTNFEIFLDGGRFSLVKGYHENYQRVFNYQNGESIRSFTWGDESGKKLAFTFRKFISMHNKHLLLIDLEIKNLGKAVKIDLKTGIDGTKSNSGSQHFEEGDKRFFENKYLYLHTNTTETKVEVGLASYLKMSRVESSRPVMGRRKLHEIKSIILSDEESLSVTKYVLVCTQRDLEADSSEYLKAELIEKLKVEIERSYEDQLTASAKAWEDVWRIAEVKIKAQDFHDQLLLNFARYHMHVMSPTHDDRLNIGAKGMSGEGYKGHTFWDTEIFILPYFTYTFPDQAKNLVNYRIKGLAAAKKNAQLNGYEGAQYPWESAWLTDGEVTPKLGDIDIITGKPTPILTGEIEHHVTGDVVYGMSDFLSATQDQSVTVDYFEVVMEAAKFWCSRVIFSEENNRYEIHDVIGPDEYKEHVNNNAYTNYLAKFTLERALSEYAKQNDNQKKTFYKKDIQTIQTVSDKIYLPQLNENNVLPQDDTYMQKTIVDLSKYLNDAEVNTIFLDYNLEQVNELQVSKQADVLLLLLLFSENYTKAALRANWDYYYPKTLHDSSLSLCMHCNYALMIGEETLAYELFEKSFEIDLGSYNMKSSDMGIHSASMGGIWQNVVKGFGGFTNEKGELHLTPRLPKAWDGLSYNIIFLRRKVTIDISHERFQVDLHGGAPLDIYIFGEKYHLENTILVEYK